jgi:uncharacterized protein (TIGR02145 family)
VNGTTREHYGKQKKQFCDERDGKKYVYVTIGEQTWMAENLNHETETVNSVCYDNNPANCAKYGRLYQWNEDIANTCPTGWHLPSKDEWGELNNFVDNDLGVSTTGRPLLALGEGTGTDRYGFSALAGGTYYYDGSVNIGTHAYWWTPTSANDGAACCTRFASASRISP